MSPDMKLTVRMGFTLRASKTDSEGSVTDKIHQADQLWISAKILMECNVFCNHCNMADCYLDLGHCHQSLYHSQCYLPPESQGSSRTCPQCHLTHGAEHEQASDHDSPLQLLAHLLFQTIPVYIQWCIIITIIIISNTKQAPNWFTHVTYYL